MPERFRRAVRRIMSGQPPAAAVLGERPDRPESFGWLRRPDLDMPLGEAWELPDGSVRITRRSGGGEGGAGRDA